MATVGFDTATEDTCVAALRGGEVVYESALGLSERGGPQHTSALLVEVERAVAAAGGWDAVTGLAVGTGPGSFTGLRVGIATARGLARSRDLPLAGVCTLDALGAAGAERSAGGETLALIDARRGELFSALYAAGGSRLSDPGVHAPAELAERVAGLERAPLGVGSGALRFREELTRLGVEVPADDDPVHRVAARHLCALASTGADGELPGPVAPIYLRPPDAERWRERDTV